MSVLIKGMEIPKKGEYRMTLYVCDGGYAYVDVDLFPVDKDRFEAVPVPPHGRTIDADALEVSLVFAEETAEWAVPALRAVLMVIDEMPTIIPAEEGKSLFLSCDEAEKILEGK